MIYNSLYREDIEYISALPLPWEKLFGRSIFVTGATGLVGSCLIDVLMLKNHQGVDCKVYAVGRDENKAIARFKPYLDLGALKFLSHDINLPVPSGVVEGGGGYLLHMASNTHPFAYSTDPVGTITTNIIGTYNLLEFAKEQDVMRCAFVSSNEVYGENRGDVECFAENYCGYIDCNTVRAGYPESKRCGESLCQAYIKKCGLDIVIPRLTRSYGPTMLMSDTKAISQFIKKAIAGEDIVLKSLGNQYYSYTYVVDAVSGLLTILLSGESGQAYNIADAGSDVMLKDLATLIAEYAGSKVIFESPDDIEKAGYSTVTKARLDGKKIKSLGWFPKYNINSGIERTIDILLDRKNH